VSNSRRAGPPGRGIPHHRRPGRHHKGQTCPATGLPPESGSGLMDRRQSEMGVRERRRINPIWFCHHDWNGSGPDTSTLRADSAIKVWPPSSDEDEPYSLIPL
jgi:hypothetical protein